MLVQSRIDQLRKIDFEIEQDIKSIKDKKMEKSDELRSIVKDMEASLVSQLHHKLSILLGMHGNLALQMLWDFRTFCIVNDNMLRLVLLQPKRMMF